MIKSNFFGVLLLISLTACGQSVEQNPPVKDVVISSTPGTETNGTKVSVQVPETATLEEIMSDLTNRDPSDAVSMQADAERLYSAYGDTTIRDMSNNLWSGNEGYERNRRASGALAVVAHQHNPQSWSLLRSGIAYVNGLGVAPNPDAAILLLSDSELEDKSAAQFFLAKAYELNGQNDLAISQMKKAAAMGHSLALKELK